MHRIKVRAGSISPEASLLGLSMATSHCVLTRSSPGSSTDDQHRTVCLQQGESWTHKHTEGKHHKGDGLLSSQEERPGTNPALKPSKGDSPAHILSL